MAKRVADFSAEEIIEAAGRLDSSELDRLVADLLALMAHRKAPALAHSEAELLQRINRSIPAALQQRYDLLVERRQAEVLTPDDYQELLLLSARIEEIEASRAADLAALAVLRKRPLAEVVTDLGIVAPVGHD